MFIFLVCIYVFIHMCSQVLCGGACEGQRSTSVDVLNLSIFEMESPIDFDAH